MKVYHKNGIDFVTDLTWQKQTESNKINLKTYRVDCKFDFYCKTTKIAVTYGFGRLAKTEAKTTNFKVRAPTALAIYVIDSVDVDADSDQFICFKFDDDKSGKKENDLYGYILLYRGSVLPEQGEFIGSLREVENRLETLARRYAIKVAFVPDDVPFYNNQVFASRAGLELIVLTAKPSRNGQLASASDYYFWVGRRSRRIAAARMRPLTLMTRNQQFALAGVILGAILSLGRLVYPQLAADDLQQLQQQVTKPLAPSIFAAAPFINSCIDKYDHVVINQNGWRTVAFKCSHGELEVNYVNEGGKTQYLQQVLTGYPLQINVSDAKLKLALNLEQALPLKSDEPKLSQIDYLKEFANKLAINLNITKSTVNLV